MVIEQPKYQTSPSALGQMRSLFPIKGMALLSRRMPPRSAGRAGEWTAYTPPELRCEKDRSPQQDGQQTYEMAAVVAVPRSIAYCFHASR
jgi:hypothetical protein